MLSYTLGYCAIACFTLAIVTMAKAESTAQTIGGFLFGMSGLGLLYILLMLARVQG